MGKQYRDEIAMVCHDMMKAAYSAGGVSDSDMKEFEGDCFVEDSEPSNFSQSSPKVSVVASARSV